MNDYEMNNEILKSVMEGMGVQPSDNMLENWNTIMNFVPVNAGYTSNYNYNGTNVKLFFNAMTGGKPYEMEFSENIPLKEALYKFGKIAHLSENEINNCQFLCNGQNLSVKTLGTIKENNLKNGAQIVLVNNFK